MPLIIEGGRIPPRWADKKNLRARPVDIDTCAANAECVRIAFVNNMPDSALEDTEIQFFELLEAAAGDVPVRLKLHSLSGVPRGERGQQHLSGFYFGTHDLLNDRFDGAIMTGTEPRQPDLRNEPYWSALRNVLDWAESNTASTILSCLAAHAGVLYSDGITRHPLGDKQFGVFDFAKAGKHQLTAGTGDRICFPHSRWNEVRAEALTASGYQVLTQSAEDGVDSFVNEEADPVRAFPGSSGVRSADFAQGIPKGHQEIPSQRKGDVPLHAQGLFRCCGHEASQRFPKCCFVRSAGRTDGWLSGSCAGRRVAEQLASFGRDDL